jgi:hypothetical protein
MRQIFTSPRLDNVQTVETLLRDAGIETRVTDGRSWNRATKRDFSYTDKSGGYKWPALWVVKADDYGAARQLLRDHGVILENTRGDTSSFLPSGTSLPVTKQPRSIGRVRIVLFAIVLAGSALVAIRLFGNF